MTIVVVASACCLAGVAREVRAEEPRQEQSAGQDRSGGPARERESKLRERERRADATLAPGTARLEVRALCEAVHGEALEPRAVRVRLTGPDGAALDATGRGLYADGRFYADGTFSVVTPPGSVRIDLASGPELVPVAGNVTLEAGEVLAVDAILVRWFSARERGWYCGDNHVHAQHDRVAAVRTDLEYAALQARAAGLDFLTEAGSHASYDALERLDRPEFLFRAADEIRPGCYVGHFNTPGIRAALAEEILGALFAEPLPATRMRDAVHALGGALVYTHPLTPPHQLHWMGATGLLSDAVLGRCGDAIDIDSPASTELWFAALNLGNRLACSASTDAALGRTVTRSPGDRRVYVRSGSFDYAAIVDSLRAGRTMATSGGPLLAFLAVEGEEPGGSLAAGGAESVDVEIELAARRPLRLARLYWRGQTLHTFQVEGRTGILRRRAAVRLPPEPRSGWLVLHAEDDAGDWATTSPVHVERAGAPGVEPARERSAVIVEISNATRFIELREDFYLHVIATVPPEERMDRVEILRDDLVLATIASEDGSSAPSGRLPVTALRGEYSRGWIWHPSAEGACHVQIDWPIEGSGWYRARVRTAAGRVVASDAVYHDAEHRASHAVSAARLRGGDTELIWRGYGEEMDLAEIRLPFEGDHWWYPRATRWSLEARFGEERRAYGSGEAGEPLVGAFVRDGEPEPPIRPHDTIRLFDGRGFTGLYTWLKGTSYRDPRDVFTVSDGILRISGDGLGYIGTLRSFRDYRLSCEFRWGERNHGERADKARDAGLFLHAVGPDGNSHDGDGAFRSAVECQIMEGAVGDLMLIRGRHTSGDPVRLELTAEAAEERDADGWPTWQPGGRPARLESWGRLNWKDKSPAWSDRFGFRGEADVESPAGEWTRIDVDARADALEVRVNGTVVNACTGVVPQAGAILLQCEGAEIEFRRWEVGPLPSR